MSGIWSNARCIYQHFFTDPAPPQPVVPVSPPPVSPIETAFCEPMHHDDVLNELLETRTPPAYAPVAVVAPPVDNDNEAYIAKCEAAFEETIRLYANSDLLCKRRDDSFGTIVGALTLGRLMPADKKAVVLDCTGSLIFPLMMRKLGYKGAFVVHPPSKMFGKAEAAALRRLTGSLSFNNADYAEVEKDYVKRFDVIFVDMIMTQFETLAALVSKFQDSISTGVIYANIKHKAAAKLCAAFPMLSFEFCPTTGNAKSNEFRAHQHSLLLRIVHAQGGVAKQIRLRRNKRNNFKSVSAPIPQRAAVVEPHPLRELLPLAVDFSFSNMLNTIQEMALEPTNATSFLDMLAPLSATKDDQTLSAVDDEEPQVSPAEESASNDEETPHEHVIESLSSPSREVFATEPAHATPPRVVVENVSREEETEIIVLSDSEPETLSAGIDYQHVVDQYARRSVKKCIKDITECMPDWSSITFGGSCPVPTMPLVCTVAKLVCAWTRTHKDATAFLDMRSKGFMAAVFHLLFPKDLTVGHVVYSDEYQRSCQGMYRRLGKNHYCPYKEVYAPIGHIDAVKLREYQMGFLCAVFLGDDNRDLGNAVEAFRHASAMQVLWVQMRPAQYRYLAETYKTIKYCELDVPRKHGASLYELTK